MTGHGLIEHNGQRVEIRLNGDLFAVGLLRRHVEQGAGLWAGGGIERVGLGLPDMCQLKIGQLEAAIFSDQDVFRL